MNNFRLATLASILVLTGCSMAPDYDKPEVVFSDVYINSGALTDVNAEQPSNQPWWYTFNDPQLNALVKDAQDQNISLKMASQRIRKAQQYEINVSSYKVPTISAGIMYSDLRLSEHDQLAGPAIDVLGMERDTNATTIGLSASWELDLFGYIDSLSQAAKVRVEQAKLMSTSINTLITADTINNYLQYQGAVERINITKKNIAEQEQTLKLVESLDRYGYGSSLDVANAKAALAAAKSNLPMLDNAKTAHLTRLAIILGENVHVTQKRFTDKPLPTMSGIIPTGIPSDLLVRRPDIKIAEREMEAMNQETGSAIANKYPHFFLTGAPGFTAGTFEDVFSSNSKTWGLGAGVSWNIFDGGRSESVVQMKEAGFRESVLNYQHTVNSAFNEVESTLKAYGNNQQFHEYIEEADLQAQVAVDKANSLYRSGLINHLSVLDAQRQKNSIQDTEVVARLSTLTTVVKLHKALGGDWDLNKDAKKTEDGQVIAEQETSTPAKSAEQETAQGVSTANE